MRLKYSFRYSASAAALACCLGAAPAALAEYPGEVWSVDSIVIKISDQGVTGLSKAKLRTGLQRANDVYFFGEDALRMQAEVSSDSELKVRLTLIDPSAGAVIARSPRLSVSADSESIEAAALAWMERLTCAQAGCASAPEAAQPVRVAKARLELPVATNDPEGSALAADGAIAGIPVPLPRPGGTGTAGKRGKAKLDGSGLSSKDLAFSAFPIQVALSVPREVGALTYTDSDQLVLDETLEVARVAPAAPEAATLLPPTRTVPTAPKAEDTIVGRWLNRVADFLGLKPTRVASEAVTPTNAQSAVQPKSDLLAEETLAKSEIPATSLAASVPVPQPSKAPAPSVWRRASEPVTLINPIERFQPAGTVPALTDGERIAVADIRRRVSDPANSGTPSGATDALSTGDLVRPAAPQRETVTPVVATPRVTRTNLSVRLHPDLLGQFGSNRLAASTPVQNRGVARPSRASSRALLDDSSKLSEVLKERGMEIDLAGYNRFERIYWSGTEDDGFWISLPNRINAKFALVSGPDASVIVSVRRRNGIARASNGVAEALALRSRQWAKLRVVGLRAINQSAGVVPLDWFTVRKGRNLIQ